MVQNRVWNVAMGMGIVVTVATLVGCGYFVVIDKMTASAFIQFAGPIVGAWAGGALALLKGESGG